MKRFLIFSGVGLAILVTLWWGVSYYNTRQQKSFSPEDHIVFEQNDLTIKVFYNRPFKKGRVIFGGLVPFDKVWRTGANEATTFETNRELFFNGKSLKPGKYSLWTIPRQETWTVIFNTVHGQWGINSDGNANRDPAMDALTIDVPAVQQETEFEQFTIAFDTIGEETEMVLFWDTTVVPVTFSY